MTVPDRPLGRDLAIEEAAAAICPAEHRRNGDAKEPPCGVCYAIAESAINAYVAHLVRQSHYGTLGAVPGWLMGSGPAAAGGVNDPGEVDGNGDESDKEGGQ